MHAHSFRPVHTPHVKSARKKIAAPAPVDRHRRRREVLRRADGADDRGQPRLRRPRVHAARWRPLAASPGSRPGVVVTDYSMPQMDGIEFIQRASRIAPNAAFIMISGDDLDPLEDELARLKRLKMRLQKPFGWRPLADADPQGLARQATPRLPRAADGCGAPAHGADQPSTLRPSLSAARIRPSLGIDAAANAPVIAPSTAVGLRPLADAQHARAASAQPPGPGARGDAGRGSPRPARVSAAGGRARG